MWRCRYGGGTATGKVTTEVEAEVAAGWRQLGGGAAGVAALAAQPKRGGGKQRNGGSAARWEQRGGCGGFIGTVRKWANARFFERH